jgi:phage-related protein
MKHVIYCGNSQKEISNFEIKAKQRVLRLLDMLRVDLDLNPKDFKHMTTVGNGVYELKVRTTKQHRVFYVAKFSNAIYVLHAFIKKTQQTSKHDIELGRQRYKAVVNYLRGTKNE